MMPNQHYNRHRAAIYAAVTLDSVLSQKLDLLKVKDSKL
jgi:hypothetical protein